MFEVHAMHPAGSIWLPIAINMILGIPWGIVGGFVGRQMRRRRETTGSVMLSMLMGGTGQTLSAFFNVGGFPVTMIVTIGLGVLLALVAELLRPGATPTRDELQSA